MSSEMEPVPAEKKDFVCHEFQTRSSEHLRRRLTDMESKDSLVVVDISEIFLGIAGLQDDNGDVQVGLAAHDGTYSVDFTTVYFSHDELEKAFPGPETQITDRILSGIDSYQHEHQCKFLGAGIEKVFKDSICPALGSALWARRDILPMVFDPTADYPQTQNSKAEYTVSEQADSMARKCLMYYGPNKQPRLEVGFRNKVEVDAGGHAQMTQLSDYRSTVGARTWEGVMKYAAKLKDRKVKIAFFNATPQGGGVALMRHALMRFFKLLDVDAKWYVPKPNPEVFRITKTNHNILQGVSKEDERMTPEQGHTITEWINQNAERYWLSAGGPLASRSNGGADVIFVDDPQMPGLIPLAKAADPDRLVLYRSHIQIRSGLAATERSPVSDVWRYLWNSGIGQADLFISHPVRDFVPKEVPSAKVGYMPATTDWLDGLNKDLNNWSTRYYMQNFQRDCDRLNLTRLDWPRRDYIVQVARFDPAKGIPDVLESYALLRKMHYIGKLDQDVPQLLITGLSSIDDPDGSIIFDQTMELLEKKYSEIAHDICVMRVGPIDHLLNALLSQAKIALQLSTREGFEVKVSEAIHKGIPIIAYLAGGIPLQIEDGKSGFVVETGDVSRVSYRMYELLSQPHLYTTMSDYAKKAVSDEVSTVGNALCWLYLADRMSKGEKPEPRGRWINDMAREEAGLPYEDGENRLPRPANLRFD